MLRFVLCGKYNLKKYLSNENLKILLVLIENFLKNIDIKTFKNLKRKVN